jgi:hypothetical protein
MIKYGPIPYELLEDTYSGIALEELTHYTIHEVYKARQAPEYNYFVVKIPPKANADSMKIKSFSFDSNSQEWKVKQRFEESVTDTGLSFDEKEGKTKNGSLKYKGGKANFYTRYISEFIEIKPNVLYKVQGFLKVSIPLETTERDGFFRIDFYGKNKKEVEGQNILKRAVSGRVFETADWVEKTIIAKSPADAYYLTISFQRNFPSRDYTVWLDDIGIYEVNDEPPEPFPNLPYIRSSLPKDLLYPNSIL